MLIIFLKNISENLLLHKERVEDILTFTLDNNFKFDILFRWKTKYIIVVTNNSEKNRHL